MNEVSASVTEKIPNLKTANATSQGDVAPENGERAPNVPESGAKSAEPKKRKTRRGKSKRKAPYQKYGRKSYKSAKSRATKAERWCGWPEAPHNDNQFLLADHFAELDERLKNIDQLSTSTVTRTRDSSFSVDSDGEEFYSSPDDEDEYLMQDFNNQYQTIQAEQLQTMSKQELIDEYLALDNRTAQKNRDLEETVRRLEKELEKENKEKETLQRENELLKTKLERAQAENSDSEDSETDSSDSCSSSSSSSCSSRSRSPLLEVDKGADSDFTHMNGHVSPPSVDAS